MRKQILNLFFLILVVVMVEVSIWGPEAFSNYRDRYLLGKTHLQEVDVPEEGFRYEMSPAEKLLVLSRALESQSAFEGRFGGDGQGQGAMHTEWSGSYALVANHRNLTRTGVSDEEIYETCNKALEELKAAGILPEDVQPVDRELYDAVLYSAIDVRETRNSVAVWQVSLSDSRRDVNKENRLMEAYMDGESGKIYQFYARTRWEWEDMDPDQLVKAWCQYLGLSAPEAYKEASLLSEATPYFKKYEISGNYEETTVVTVGFYEGIREMFVRIAE